MYVDRDIKMIVKYESLHNHKNKLNNNKINIHLYKTGNKPLF